MKTTVICLMLAFSLSVAAQEKKEAAPTLTPEQKLAIRSAELKRYQLQEQLRVTNEQFQKAIDDSVKSLQQVIDSAYGSLKIKTADWQLCENPSPGPCEKAPANDLSLQSIKKEK